MDLDGIYCGRCCCLEVSSIGAGDWTSTVVCGFIGTAVSISVAIKRQARAADHGSAIWVYIATISLSFATFRCACGSVGGTAAVCGV